MLSYPLIHPEIIGALAGAGHGSKVLITDSNYPASTKIGPNAQLVYLNLTPGLPNATDVFKTLLSAIQIEQAAVMEPAGGGAEPEVFDEFRELLPKGMDLQRLGRFEFYDAGKDDDTALVIQTGDKRFYANVLLTIGAIPPK